MKLSSIVLVASMALAGAAQAAERLPSISQTKQASEAVLNVLVPYSENLERSHITVHYEPEKNVQFYAAISCDKLYHSAEIVYDSGLIYSWEVFGQVAVAAVLSHELAHCSNANAQFPSGPTKETNADLGGFDIFYRAGYDPQRYLDTYKARNGVSKNGSHPTDKNRIISIRKYAKAKYGLELK